MHFAIRKDAVAVITGAAVGIGYAIAERLAREGMKLVLLDKNIPALSNAIKRLRTKFPELTIHHVYGDITSPKVQQNLHYIAVSTGEIGILVNNSAIHPGANPWEDLPKWRSLMEVNFWSVLMLQEKFIQTLSQQQQQSAIVNLGSKEGITTPPGNAAYSVSKAAIRVLTEQLAHELRERYFGKISAHLLIPGFTYTPMNFPDVSFDSPKPDAPWHADQVAERLLQGMAQDDFYIFCEDNEVTWELDQRRMQWSADDLIQNRPALSRWHPEWMQQFKDYVGNTN